MTLSLQKNEEIDEEIKYIVFGFIRENYSNNVATDIIFICVLFLGDNEIKFDFYPNEYCEIIENGTLCIGLGAHCVRTVCCVSSNGFDEGIHEWSIKCYQPGCDYYVPSIGVVSNYNDAIYDNNLLDKLGSYAYYAGYGAISVTGCYRSNLPSFPEWNKGDIIGIKLNCVLWTISFSKNNKFITKQQLPKKHIKYHPAIQFMTSVQEDAEFKLLT
eukprot:506579_1